MPGTCQTATLEKSLYTVRGCIPNKMKTMLINALVLSHQQFSAVILATIDQNLIITYEKQLSLF